jgi:hypothetical protein
MVRFAGIEVETNSIGVLSSNAKSKEKAFEIPDGQASSPRPPGDAGGRALS